MGEEAKGKGTWYPHLHAHDEHSIKDGCAPCERYADLVVEQGGRALCVTNHGQAAGFARQYFACQDRKIKAIFGMEAYLNEHRLKPIRALVDQLKAEVKKETKAKSGKQRKAATPAMERLAKADHFLKKVFKPSRHAIILARTRKGYSNLVRMSTDSWLRGFYYSPRTDTTFLAEHAEGLVYSTACIGGYIPRMAAENFDAAVRESRRLQGIFGHDSFYVEIMITGYRKQQEVNQTMLRLAEAVGAPVIATCDVHYARPRDAMAQSALLLLRDDFTFDDVKNFQAKVAAGEQIAGEGPWQFEAKDLYWRSLEDVHACWKEHHAHYLDRATFLKAVKTTYELADSIEDFRFDTSLKLPGVFKEADQRLKDLAIQGLRAMVDRGVAPASGHTKLEYAQRIKRELDVVSAKGFAEYFLVLHDVCRHAREIGARMGPGRGSAGGSMLAWLLGITEIDPLRFGLLFERFLDVGRADPPDIDLDFSPEHRDTIKAYLQAKYPATATIGTYATFKTRATLGDAGRVFNLDYREMNKITTPLGMDADKLDWKEIFGLWPAVADWAKKNPDAFRVAATLRGLISHRGKNAAGMLIAPPSALDDLPMIVEQGGQVVTAFPDSQGDGVKYKGRELTRLGYLKLDLLGVRNLNPVFRAVEIVERNGGQVDREAMPLDHPGPLDDPATLAMAATGDVPGTFQLDTATTRPILRLVGVDSFMDLAIITSLARPGPLENGLHVRFAKAKRSGEAWKETVPESVHDVLETSRGMMIFQEDVMFVLQRMGGFSMQEANEIRKISAKKLDPALLVPWKEKFVQGGVRLGHDAKELTALFDTLDAYAGYSFNRSHAVGYMVTAYRQLYMLTHYPLEYFAATLAETPRGKKAKEDVPLISLMRSAMARGLPVSGPDVLRSNVDFDVADDLITFGLSKVKGVASSAEAVVAARPFETLESLMERAERRRANRKVLISLVHAGAMDRLPLEGEGELPRENEEVLERRNTLVKKIHELRPAKDQEAKDLSLVALRDLERELVGVAFSWWSSPDKDRLREQANLTTIAQAVEQDEESLHLLAEITKVKPHKTSKGDTMAFMGLADETAVLDNLVIWPSQWEEYREHLKQKGRVVVIHLTRRETRDRTYGRWSYHLDERKDQPVDSAQRVLRRTKR